MQAQKHANRALVTLDSIPALASQLSLRRIASARRRGSHSAGAALAESDAHAASRCRAWRILAGVYMDRPRPNVHVALGAFQAAVPALPPLRLAPRPDALRAPTCAPLDGSAAAQHISAGGPDADQGQQTRVAPDALVATGAVSLHHSAQGKQVEGINAAQASADQGTLSEEVMTELLQVSATVQCVCNLARREHLGSLHVCQGLK
jgi:hypothetical protein